MTMGGKIHAGARIILGLIYLVFGGMGLAMVLGLMQMPTPEMPEAAMAFNKGMAASVYFMPLLKVTEVVGGLLLLVRFAAPLALVILAPITLHIILFHAFLTPGINNLILPGIMGLLHVIAIAGYWGLYKPLLSRK
jgi:putative oxidoreductase